MSKIASVNKIEMLGIADIRPYEKNPRLNDSAVKFVVNSIQQFGFKIPIVIDAEGVIVCGHTRWKAAKKLKMAKVPCIRADDLDEAQIRAFRIADNKVGEMAEWDMGLLGDEVKGTPEFNFADFGFTTDEMRALCEGVESLNTDDINDTAASDERADNEPKRIQSGEIWKVGEQYLMCGDSTDAPSVARLVAATGRKSVDLLITDPPYNVAYEGGTDEELTIANDNMGNAAFERFLTDAFRAADSVMKPGAPFYIWHALWTVPQFKKAMTEVKWTERQYLIWVKDSLALGRSDYQWRHEPCYYGWKDGASHYFTEARAISTVIDDLLKTDIDKVSLEDARALLKRIWKLPTTVLRFPKPTRNSDHPTMKPVELFKELVANSSRYGDLVLDIFAGSGTTGVASHLLGRTSAMMELDPKYANRILCRLEKEIGIEAVKVEA